MTGVIELLVILAIVGVVTWALVTYVPMPAPVRGIIIVVAVLICLLIVLRAFGGLTDISVPQIQ